MRVPLCYDDVQTHTHTYACDGDEVIVVLQLDGRKRNKSYEEKRWSWARQTQNKTSSTQTPPTSSPEGKKRKEFLVSEQLSKSGKEKEYHEKVIIKVVKK